MTDRITLSADLKFVEGVIKAGGQDLKKCYQCSSCTVACPLTPEGAPFPRKEMIHAQWGIKDKLIKSMDPWLCFHCNDCSDQCPRDAKPGDVMAAIRNMIIASVAVPSIFARATQSVGSALLLLLIPIILIGAVIFAIHGGDFGFINSDPIVFSNMISVTFIDIIFLPTAAFALITGFLGIKNLLAGLRETYPSTDGGMSLKKALVATLMEFVTHKRFKECGINKSRNIAHLALVYGFVGLALTTACVVVIHYGNHFLGWFGYDTPLPFTHPVKILGNVSALAGSIGILLIAGRRIGSSVIGKSVAFDWIFIGDVLLVIATGILSQVVRVAESSVAFLIYYCHLVLVFFLFAYAPHSKFGHIFYRTAALVYSKYSGRDKSVGASLLTTGKNDSREVAKDA